MFKTVLKFIAATLLLSISFYACSAQEFDRLLEKDIKTEINLNRIAKSQSPLHLSTYLKAATDSITQKLVDSYVKNSFTNSRGAQEDWKKIWEPIDREITKNYGCYNIVVINDSDYRKELKQTLFDKQSYYYKLENSQMSLSAIRYDNKIFLAVLTW